MNDQNRALALQFAMSEMPREACGLVIVEKGKEVFVPCRNRSRLADQFEIEAEDYAAAEERGEILEVFHSHVYARPFPSEADKVACEETAIPWEIVSVPNGEWFSFKPSGYRAPLVGRTWAHGVLDCYSIIRDYYKEVLAIEIPDFNRDFEWWLRGENLYVDNFAKAGFREIPIEELRKHDVILMQVASPVVNHGAVYLGDDVMLHHLHKRLSSRETFAGYYRKHSVKYLRHKDL